MPHITARPRATYQVGSPETGVSLIVADLRPRFFYGQVDDTKVDAHVVATAIAPYIQHDRGRSVELQEFTDRLVAHMMKTRGRYRVVYEGQIGARILAFGFMGRVDRVRERKLGYCPEYGFEQFGVTKHFDARSQVGGAPEYLPVGSVHLLAAAALLHTESRQLPANAIIYVVPHPPDDTRDGHFFQRTGFTPADAGYTWQQGGVVKAYAGAVRQCLEADPGFDFLLSRTAESATV